MGKARKLCEGKRALEAKANHLVSGNDDDGGGDGSGNEWSYRLEDKNEK